MVVHDQPDAIDLPEACRPTQPHVDGTTRERAVDVVEAMNEGDLAVRRHRQVTYLVGNCGTWCGAHFWPGSTFLVSPVASQRWSEIERNEVARVEGHDAVDVLCAYRFRQVLDTFSNEGFSHVFLRLSPMFLNTTIRLSAQSSRDQQPACGTRR